MLRHRYAAVLGANIAIFSLPLHVLDQNLDDLA